MWSFNVDIGTEDEKAKAIVGEPLKVGGQDALYPILLFWKTHDPQTVFAPQRLNPTRLMRENIKEARLRVHLVPMDILFGSYALVVSEITIRRPAQDDYGTL
ncbi:hypothetical protein [Sulfobacillus thermosulfidooxidans]|uniref:hypothetical protein n=1 Tax=Sulfobacillus thermosulfidooxidans TaxID=28034 RepID=UPI0002D9F666|nr:hypothetical protein [Sulfobacillus thermosulfidooxidans]